MSCLANKRDRFADAVREEPSSFQGAAKGAGDLVRTDALFGRREQENRLQPMAKRHMRGLEYGPDLHGEWLAALVALVGPNAGRFAAHLGNALGAAVANGGTRDLPATRAFQRRRTPLLRRGSDCLKGSTAWPVSSGMQPTHLVGYAKEFYSDDQKNKNPWISRGFSGFDCCQDGLCADFLIKVHPNLRPIRGCCSKLRASSGRIKVALDR